jgi:hypothetical protein
MAVQRSPGQKRLRRVRIIMVLLFIAITYLGSHILGYVKTKSLEWVNDHQQVNATIVDKKHVREEYRNLKGRKRMRDAYYVSYRFIAADREYTKTIKIDDFQYDEIDKGDEVPVWYASGDPSKNDLVANIVLDKIGNTTVSNMISVLFVTVPVCLFLYYMLKLIFVREAKKALPDGFYTENSWLDIDDNYVVALENSELIYFNIHPKRAGRVQEAYQKDATVDELFELSGAKGAVRIPMNKISKLSSCHNTDTIRIKHEDKSHSVEFLNQTVKAHALERVKKLIPASLEYSIDEPTRLRAAMPSVIFLLILAGLFYYFDNPVAIGVIAFITIIWTIPTVFSRLLDPPVTQRWQLPGAD